MTTKPLRPHIIVYFLHLFLHYFIAVFPAIFLVHIYCSDSEWIVQHDHGEMEPASQTQHRDSSKLLFHVCGKQEGWKLTAASFPSMCDKQGGGDGQLRASKSSDINKCTLSLKCFLSSQIVGFGHIDITMSLHCAFTYVLQYREKYGSASFEVRKCNYSITINCGEPNWG